MPPTKKQWILGLRGVGNCQPVQNIIITILNHEHFSHGTSTFNGNSVLSTLPFSPWAFLATWLHVEALQKIQEK
jgi:hypothetical protein